MSVSDNSILRAAAHFNTINGSEAVNVFHFVMDSVGAVDESDVLDDLLGYVQGLMASIEGFYSSSLVLDFLVAWVWNAALSRWDAIGQVDGTWAGTQGSDDNEPAQIAPQVNADTVDAHSHGRKYLPPPLETAMSEGVAGGSFVTALLNYFDDYVATYPGVSAEYAVGLWQRATESFKQFTGTGTVRSRPGTQRRRKANVGS